MAGVRTRLPARLAVTLLATALFAASAAQGLELMRCGSSVSVAASCCCHGKAAQGAEVSAARGSCVRLAIPAAQAQVEHRAAVPLAAPLAVALFQQALPLPGALLLGAVLPAAAPPPASPLLLTCSLLI